MENPAILYVDDDALLRKALPRLLRRDPVDVLTAETCDQALTLATEHKARLKAIVLDYSLAVDKTSTIIGLLRESFGPDFPIIGFSTEYSTAQRDWVATCSEVIEKPDMSRLAERVRELLVKTD